METDPIADLTTSTAAATILTDATAVTVEILFIIILLAFFAMLSGSEVAKDRYWSAVLRNQENPEKLLSTLWVIKSMIIPVILILAFHLCETDGIREHLLIKTQLAVAGTILFILLLTDLLPKALAEKHAFHFTRFTAAPLIVFQQVLSPLNRFLIRLSLSIRSRIGKKTRDFSLDEISQALEMNHQEQNYGDREILEGIVKFGDKSAGDIMRPRTDVVALNIEASAGHVLEVINESGYSRIPVFSETFDHVQGILYIKDLLPYLGRPENFQWQSILRPPFFVPESKKIDDLLEEFQKNKVHMAIVVDEYGGSSGIVTLQDILEEIVGDFLDEFDEDEHYSTRLGENRYLFDGRVQLEDFYRFTGSGAHIFDECKGEADTLAGLILEIKGEIPKPNERIKYRNFTFTIDAVDDRRIRKIRVEITQAD